MSKLLAIWTMIAMTGFGCKSTPAAHNGRITSDPIAAAALLKDATPIKGSSVTLVVHGMSCPLCANNVDKTLVDIAGVESATVNLDTGRVIVATPGPTKPTRSNLANAVQASGFTLIRLEEVP